MKCLQILDINLNACQSIIVCFPFIEQTFKIIPKCLWWELYQYVFDKPLILLFTSMTVVLVRSNLACRPRIKARCESTVNACTFSDRTAEMRVRPKTYHYQLEYTIKFRIRWVIVCREATINYFLDNIRNHSKINVGFHIDISNIVGN